MNVNKHSLKIYVQNMCVNIYLAKNRLLSNEIDIYIELYLEESTLHYFPIL